MATGGIRPMCSDHCSFFVLRIDLKFQADIGEKRNIGRTNAVCIHFCQTVSIFEF
jgi:hypothetical protein